MKTYFLVIVIIFCSSTSFAQNSTPVGSAAELNLEDLGRGSYGGTVWTYDNRYEGVKGSPYFFDNWNLTSISIQNKIYQKVPVKYNVLENNILFRYKGNKDFVLDIRKIDYFTIIDSITSEIKAFKKLGEFGEINKDLSNELALSLFEGDKTSLLLHKSKNIVKADYKEGYSAGRRYDEIVDNNSYYLFKYKKSYKVKLNKKNLMNLFPDKGNEIKSFISKEKIDASTEKGWVKVLSYYDTL